MCSLEPVLLLAQAQSTLAGAVSLAQKWKMMLWVFGVPPSSRKREYNSDSIRFCYLHRHSWLFWGWELRKEVAFFPPNPCTKGEDAVWRSRALGVRVQSVMLGILRTDSMKVNSFSQSLKVVYKGTGIYWMAWMDVGFKEFEVLCGTCHFWKNEPSRETVCLPWCAKELYVLATVMEWECSKS